MTRTGLNAFIEFASLHSGWIHLFSHPYFCLLRSCFDFCVIYTHKGIIIIHHHFFGHETALFSAYTLPCLDLHASVFASLCKKKGNKKLSFVIIIDCHHDGGKQKGAWNFGPAFHSRTHALRGRGLSRGEEEGLEHTWNTTGPDAMEETGRGEGEETGWMDGRMVIAGP